VDEIWHAAGDKASDIDWYAKRTILGGIYSTTEIYMLTDSSPGLFFFSSLLKRRKNCYNLPSALVVFYDHSFESTSGSMIVATICFLESRLLFSRIKTSVFWNQDFPVCFHDNL